jgi:hypothetical protein
MLFHHDPMHSDDFLDGFYREARDRWRGIGGDEGAIELATERGEIDLPSDVGAPIAEMQG